MSGQSNIHRTLDFCSRQARKKANVLSHKLCDRMDGTQFWCFPWFPANFLLCIILRYTVYIKTILVNYFRTFFQLAFFPYLGAGYQLPKVQAESLVLIDSKVKLDPFTFRVHVDEPSLTFKVKLINSNVTWKLIFFPFQTLLQTFLFTFSCMYSKTFLLYNSSFFESYITICMCCLKSSILHEIAWFYVDGFSYWVA